MTRKDKATQGVYESIATLSQNEKLETQPSNDSEPSLFRCLNLQLSEAPRDRDDAIQLSAEQIAGLLTASRPDSVSRTFRRWTPSADSETVARRQVEPGTFSTLAASGWHTAALTIKLIVESELRIAGGLVGSGLDEFQWYRPVRPGDSLVGIFDLATLTAPIPDAGLPF